MAQRDMLLSFGDGRDECDIGGHVEDIAYLDQSGACDI